MKRLLPILMSMVLAIVTVISLTGCGEGPKTLEDYVSDSPSTGQAIEKSLSGLKNDDMNYQVTYDQNRIIITCSMKSTYKKTVLKRMKKTYARYTKKHLTEPMTDAVRDIEQQTGLTGVSIQVIVNNGNGKEIWSGIYPEE